jgi:hypothetical protein
MTMPTMPIAFMAVFQGVLVLVKAVAIWPDIASPMYTPTYSTLVEVSNVQNKG